jgi:hypothetical protein
MDPILQASYGAAAAGYQAPEVQQMSGWVHNAYSISHTITLIPYLAYLGPFAYTLKYFTHVFTDALSLCEYTRYLDAHTSPCIDRVSP